MCIFGICGACRSHELPAVLLDDIQKKEDVYLVSIPDTKTHVKRSFTIGEPFFSIVKKYADLRPATVQHKKFFLNYQRGKCTVQTIGQNKFYKMAKRVAEYLGLADADRYTGKCNLSYENGIFINFLLNL